MTSHIRRLLARLTAWAASLFRRPAGEAPKKYELVGPPAPPPTRRTVESDDGQWTFTINDEPTEELRRKIERDNQRRWFGGGCIPSVEIDKDTYLKMQAKTDPTMRIMCGTDPHSQGFVNKELHCVMEYLSGSDVDKPYISFIQKGSIVRYYKGEPNWEDFLS